MRLDGRAVVRADVDVDAEHPALRDARIERRTGLDGVADVEQRQHRGAEDQ